MKKYDPNVAVTEALYNRVRASPTRGGKTIKDYFAYLVDKALNDENRAYELEQKARMYEGQ